MTEHLRKQGWEVLPSGQDFIKGKLLLSLFKKSWQLFHMEQREFVIQKDEELKYSDIKSLKL